jgi:hypothetical protein
MMKHERCSPPRCCRHRLLPATGLHCIELTPPLEQQSQVVHRHDRYTQVEESSVAAAATLRTRFSTASIRATEKTATSGDKHKHAGAAQTDLAFLFWRQSLTQHGIGETFGF